MPCFQKMAVGEVEMYESANLSTSTERIAAILIEALR